MKKNLLWLVGVLGLLLLHSAQVAWGQNSSLFARRPLAAQLTPGESPHGGEIVERGMADATIDDPDLMLRDGSWTYAPLPPSQRDSEA